jgi:hypothetical protein
MREPPPHPRFLRFFQKTPLPHPTPERVVAVQGDDPPGLRRAPPGGGASGGAGRVPAEDVALRLGIAEPAQVQRRVVGEPLRLAVAEPRLDDLSGHVDVARDVAPRVIRDARWGETAYDIDVAGQIVETRFGATTRRRAS